VAFIDNELNALKNNIEIVAHKGYWINYSKEGEIRITRK
jgi:hypothetical protein